MVTENVYCICEIKVAGDFGKAVSDEGWGGKADRVSEGRPGVGTNSSQQVHMGCSSSPPSLWALGATLTAGDPQSNGKQPRAFMFLF